MVVSSGAGVCFEAMETRLHSTTSLTLRSVSMLDQGSVAPLTAIACCVSSEEKDHLFTRWA